MPHHRTLTWALTSDAIYGWCEDIPCSAGAPGPGSGDAHGVVETPAFVAVATRGTVRALSSEDLESLGVQILIANTYHLFLRPGPEAIAEHGGLHSFTGWHGPWMTDSGGFQVFSLGAGKLHGVGKIASIFPGEAKPNPAGLSLVELTEEGAWIRSIFDGAKYLFSPEEVSHPQHRAPPWGGCDPSPG
ncbi:MAG: tRNA-guanine transglycosylase [Candidatus Bipolaricaulaceae bacterium]